MIRMIKESIPESVQEKFGNILFGSIRGFSEKDTPHESWVYRKIYRYFTGEGMRSDEMEEIEQAFRELQQVRQYYPDVLEPDVSRFIFRGVGLVDSSTIETFREQGFLDTENYKRIPDRDIAVARNFIYQPRHFVESWTTNSDFARYMGSSITDAYILFETKDYRKEEMLFSTEFTNFLDRKYGKEYEEDEMVRLSNQELLVNAIIKIPERGSTMEDLIGEIA